MSDATKRPRGRPPRTDVPVQVSFKMQKEQADYLTAVGKRFGWGTEINDVVRSILVAEVVALQKRRFHDENLPQT